MLSIGNAHTEINVECEACGHENTGVDGIYERDTGASYPASRDERCTWCGAFLEDGSGQDPNYDEDAGCLIDPETGEEYQL